MANSESVDKRHRQSLRRRLRNRTRKSQLRSAVKQVRTAVSSGDAEQARQLLPQTLSLFDRTAQSGAIHANAANRGKSRLTRLVRGIEEE